MSYCKELTQEAKESIRQDRINVNIELFNERFPGFKYNPAAFHTFIATLKESKPQSNPLVFHTQDGCISNGVLSIIYGLIKNGKLATRNILNIPAFELIKTYGVGFEGTNKRNKLLNNDLQCIIISNVGESFGYSYKNYADTMWNEIMDYQKAHGYLLFVCIDSSPDTYLSGTLPQTKKLLSKMKNIKEIYKRGEKDENKN